MPNYSPISYTQKSPSFSEIGPNTGSLQALGEFRDGLRSFRRGLEAWKHDVLGVVATTNASLTALGSELQGFIAMVLPLPHLDAPPRLDTSHLSHQQLGTAVRHLLGKYREADARAHRLNAALQDSRYVQLRRGWWWVFGPPVGSHARGGHQLAAAALHGCHRAAAAS